MVKQAEYRSGFPEFLPQPAGGRARGARLPAPDVRAARVRLDRDELGRGTRSAAPEGRDRQRGLRPAPAARRRRRRPQRPRAALRPHRSAGPLRRGQRRPARVPVPSLPDPEVLARRAAAGGPLPGVHPGRHRRRRQGRALVRGRRRDRRGHGRGAVGAAGARRCASRSTTAGSWRASSSASAPPTPPRPCGPWTSWTRSSPTRSAGCSSTRPGCPATAPTVASRWPRIATPDTSFAAAVRDLGVEHPLLDQGLTELTAVMEAALEVATDRVEVVADLRIARGLDYYTGTVFETRMQGWERIGSVCSGGRYDALATDGRTTYPGVGISLGVDPAAGAAAHRRRARRQPLGPVSRAGRAAGRGVAAAPVAPSPSSCGPAASRPRWRRIRRSTAARSATPSAGASRTCGSRSPTARTRCATSGPGDSARPTRCTWSPPDADPLAPVDRPRGASRVIRTHEAGTLRIEQAGETVTLAGWVARRRDHGGVAFLDLRDASGVVQVVVRDEEAAHGLRSEQCLRIVGTVTARPAGNENPNLPTGAIEVVATDRRGAQRRRTPAVPGGGRARRRGERGDPAAPPLPRPASGVGPAAAAPAVGGEPDRPRGDGRAPVPRGRDAVPHPVHARGRARLPGPRPPAARHLVRAAAVTAAVQAVAHGRRSRALLPDRALLPRRGLPGRPAAGVHPARHRDELRRPGRRDRAGRGGAWPGSGASSPAPRSRRRSRG